MVAKVLSLKVYKKLFGILFFSLLVTLPATVAGAAPVTPQEIVADGATGVQFQYSDAATARYITAGAADTQGKPIKGQSHFRAGSVTKTIISTALLQLAEQNKVDLNQTIDRYLPGVYDFGKTVTITQLLAQTSGLRTGAYETQFPYNPDTILTLKGTQKYLRTYRDPRDITRYINTTGLNAQPGTLWQYSNANYFIASQIISAVTHQPYQHYIEKHIFTPLGMRETSLPIAQLPLPQPFTRGYQPSEFYSGQPGGESIDLTKQSPSMFTGSGNVISTTGDLSTFFKNLSQGKLLNEHSLSLMHTADVANPIQYGLGIMQFTTPCGMVRGHSGNVYGYATEVYSLGSATVAISITEGSSLYASHSEKSMRLALEALCPALVNQPIDALKLLDTNEGRHTLFMPFLRS